MHYFMQQLQCIASLTGLDHYICEFQHLIGHLSEKEEQILSKVVHSISNSPA